MGTGKPLNDDSMASSTTPTYRNHGADFGRVLAGFEVPVDDRSEFEAFLTTLGYRYVTETDNGAYRFFLA